jgi:ribonuclease P protein component
MSMSRRREFARVRNSGKSLAGRHLVMATLADPAVGHLKVGVITSRRVGKAVVRNRLRRRLRALLSKHGAELAGGRYLVVVARKGAGEANFRALEDDWLRLARRLGILRERHEADDPSCHPALPADPAAGAEDAGGAGGGVPV